MMSSSIKYGAATLLVITGVSIPVWRQYRHSQQLTEENRQLRQRVARLDPLEAEIGRLTQALGEANKAQTQQAKDFQELLRLRGEVSLLHRQLNAAGTNKTQPAAPASPTDTAIPSTTMATSVRAYMPKGQTLLLGGQASQPGKRLLTFISPEYGTANVGSNQVMVTARLAEVPEHFLATLGLESWATSNDPDHPPRSLLTGEQMQSILHTLEQTSEVVMLAMPRITTQDGRPARIALGGSPAGQEAVRQPLPADQAFRAQSGQPVPVSVPLSDKEDPATTGLTIDFTPVVAPDGSAVDLSVNLQIGRTKPN